jgi:hypothetical protein
MGAKQEANPTRNAKLFEQSALGRLLNVLARTGMGATGIRPQSA